MLSYQVSPYPEGFGTLGNGLELTINGDSPNIDPSTGKYAVRYMKSDATVTFGFTTSTSSTLSTDWIVDGPTSWDGSTMASGVGHTTDTSPVMQFCKNDLSSATGCAQGEQWNVKLMLHDDAGHSRIIDVTVETNDVYADEYRPTANAEIDMRPEYADQVEFTGTKTVSSTEWDIYRITLDDDGETTIHFDASNSSDQDALEGNGIETYQWKVLFDAPYGVDDFALEGHTFVQTDASDGEWAYNFKNETVDSTGANENTIRMELVTYDKAGKISEKFRMFFVIVPAGFGDEEPVVQINSPSANSRIDTDTITISGSVLSGSEQGEVYIEAAFVFEDFNESFVQQYNKKILGTWNKSTSGLGDGDAFDLTLSMDGMYTNKSQVIIIYIKIYEGIGDDQRWISYQERTINLPACQGVEADVAAEAAGGEWILDADGECQWDGAWAFENGEWKAPSDDGGSSETSGSMDMATIGIIAVVIIAILAVTMVIMRRGSSDSMDDTSKDFHAAAGGFAGAQLDPVEQYVQQLVAQGYPEETARQYAQQYAAQAGIGEGAAAAAPVAAAPVAAAPVAAQVDPAVYQQYLQQFMGQGYDEATAAQYAQQYALQYAQQQG